MINQVHCAYRFQRTTILEMLLITKKKITRLGFRRSSIRMQTKKKSMIKLQDQWLKAAFRVTMALSLPMDKQGQAKHTP